MTAVYDISCHSGLVAYRAVYFDGLPCDTPPLCRRSLPLRRQAAAIKNDTISGLLNATLGNAVEMILSVLPRLFSAASAAGGSASLAPGWEAWGCQSDARRFDVPRTSDGTRCARDVLTECAIATCRILQVSC